MIELNGKPFGEMQQTFGGDTLNAAIYLCRSQRDLAPELSVKYVTAVGSEPLSQEMTARWKHEGVDTSLVLTDTKRSPGLYLIQLDEQGERTFLYWRDQSAAKHLVQHPAFAQVTSDLKSADMVFVSGISLAILPKQDRALMLALLVQLRDTGVEIAFDSNYRPVLWPDDNHQTVQSVYHLMYRTTDLALVTFEDEQAIWGDETPLQTCERLTSFGVKTVVVKLGADGCLVSELGVNEPYNVSTTVVENVVDTTSAGDSFNGGFLATYLETSDIKQACHNGNVLAGEVIQHKGAIISKAYTDAAKNKLE